MLRNSFVRGFPPRPLHTLPIRQASLVVSSLGEGRDRWVVCSSVCVIKIQQMERRGGVPSGACGAPHSHLAETPWPTATCPDTETLLAFAQGQTVVGPWGDHLPPGKPILSLTLMWPRMKQMTWINMFSLWEIWPERTKRMGHLEVEEIARKRLNHINVWILEDPEPFFVPGLTRPWRFLFLDVCWLVLCHLG